jgi:hypothetical protein
MRPLLAIWGKNDPFFIPPGAKAYPRDNPNATVQFLDTGHFAVETHVAEIAAAMRQFLAKHRLKPDPHPNMHGIAYSASGEETELPQPNPGLHHRWRYCCRLRDVSGPSS